MRKKYAHLGIQDYNEFARKFKEIFSSEDLGNFIAYHNIENNNLMLWYIWQRHIKKLFEDRTEWKKIVLKDLTYYPNFALDNDFPDSLIFDLDSFN